MRKQVLWVAIAFGIGLLAQQRSQSLTALDYAEIHQLSERYGLYIDTCSNNGYDYADLYTQDGTSSITSPTKASNKAASHEPWAGNNWPRLPVVGGWDARMSAGRTGATLP